MATSSVCSCLGNLQSRYKRLVNNVFPSNPSQGLVKSNMEKLTFYALQAPEKLDRIGDYIVQKINNYFYRKKIDYVYIAMEAMDHLLLACRSSSLNLFVESFLKMVSLLLESNEVGLQIRATSSFVKFANIDEDTPSYHRRYEFFISRFSQLCYGNDSNKETEKKIRLSGLQGLQGVVRKTVNDDLQANIWDDTHMSKIVPSLLFNIECNSALLLRRSSTDGISKQEEDRKEQDDPAVLADICLRELINRAGFNNISAILNPLLKFMDERDLWSKNEFPLHIFKIIMYSIPNQYSYRAIELLFSHLDKHQNSEAKMRASVVEMISASVGIATGGSIGPALLEVFNTLLKHLKISVDFMCDSADSGGLGVKSPINHPEILVQNAIINAAGVFSSIIADYQRVDVMLFIILKIPSLSISSKKGFTTVNYQSLIHQEEFMQIDLLKCLLEVTRSHQVKQFSSTFATKLLDGALTGMCVENAEVRHFVLDFWILLLDRHENIKKLDSVSCSLTGEDVSFNFEKCSRQDSMFFKKYRQSFFYYIYESCQQQTNKPINLKLLSHFICLLLLECQEEDHVVELVGFVLGLQQGARSNNNKLSVSQVACIHALTVLFFLLLSEVTCITAVKQLCEEVISYRLSNSKWLLPSTIFSDGFDESLKITIPDNDQCFFDRSTILSALKNNNYETNTIEMPYEPKCTVERTVSVTSIPDNFPIRKFDSQVSIKSGSQYRASLSDPPAVQKITYEDLKDALRGENTDRKSSIVLDFNKTSYHEIVSHNEKCAQEFEGKVKKALDVASRPNFGTKYQQEVCKNLFEIEFPSLFIY